MFGGKEGAFNEGDSQPVSQAEVGGRLQGLGAFAGLTEVKRYWWLLKKAP